MSGTCPMSEPLRPPMPYSGGKQRVAQAIADLFPPHTHYVEPFCGALSVLLAKTPSRIETINDISGDIVTFWRVLRDRPGDLERVCALTPTARGEYWFVPGPQDQHDDLERARRIWVQLTQGRGARLGHRGGWRFVHASNGMSLTQYLDGYLDRIGPCARRLRNVAIDNRDALDVVRIYDAPDTLMYIDPPYLAEVRHGTQYAHEMATRDEHEALLDVLTSGVSMFAVSGYGHPLYDEAFAGWERHEFPARAMTGAARVEVLWTNFPRMDMLDFADKLGPDLGDDVALDYIPAEKETQR